MSEKVLKLEAAASGVLARETELTPERIREILRGFTAIPGYEVDDEQLEQLAREFEARHHVTMQLGSVLTERDYVPWLDAARHDIDPYYWSRYRQWLVSDKKFSSQVIASLDDVTERILGLMEDPRKEGSWDRRGMVVGHVQSGKTANYTGLICKAADAGYRLIVVIAGIHNNLRNQTQQRVDEGFVGFDSSRLTSNRKAKERQKVVGVGRYNSSRRPWTFTTSVRDFNKNSAEQIGGSLSGLAEPAIFVVKKNSNTLKNLLEWLKQHNARVRTDSVDAPMLVIDDEADNASINTKHGKGEVTRINGQIRELLTMFRRSCYVGYTATPFANIFVDPDTTDEMVGHDLFPRDFIVSLDPPSNYFGPERVFLSEDGSPVRYIEDNADLLPVKHENDHAIEDLPPSMIDAMRTFLIARAIRLARGHHSPHCSMLVNASRFTIVQARIRNSLHSRLERIQNSTRLYGALSPAQSERDFEIRELRRCFNKEYANLEFTWRTILPWLSVSALPVRVVEVNSRSSGSLNYSEYQDTGLNVIAVGGYSLSRGLTLEGLLVSYYLRNSMMYDTLMQMARWFGYRPGYEDLCRVWMPEEAEDWYQHISESIELLRDEFRSMEAAGATPRDFGLKVRSHPHNLIVTARNKMGSGERIIVNVGLGNHFVETPILRDDELGLEQNRNAATDLVENLKGVGITFAEEDWAGNGWLVSDVPVDPIIDFLRTFAGHPGAMLAASGPLLRYIQERSDTQLSRWDVLFVSTTRKDEPPDVSLGIPIRPQRRTAGNRTKPGEVLWISNKQRVASRGVEKTGLTPEQIECAERKYMERHGLDRAYGRVNYPDRIYREVRSRPLLIVHLLRINGCENMRRSEKPVVAWSISFPKPDTEEYPVEYVVNTTWLREYYYELEEEELAGDV